MRALVLCCEARDGTAPLLYTIYEAAASEVAGNSVVLQQQKTAEQQLVGILLEAIRYMSVKP